MPRSTAAFCTEKPMLGTRELLGVRQGRIIGDQIGTRRINRFAVDGNRIGKIPGDHARLGVAIGRTAVLDRDTLDSAGKIERPGHGIGIGGIHTLDDFHFLRREILVPTELLEHRQGELRISVLDFGADRIRALGEQVIVLLLSTSCPFSITLRLTTRSTPKRARNVPPPSFTGRLVL